TERTPPTETRPAPRVTADPAELARALEAYRRGDYATAMDIIRPLAGQGDPTAQSRPAGLLARGAGAEPDVVEAARWYRKGAEGGDPIAQDNLGSMLSEGRGVARDEAEAVVWWERAAERGVTAAQVKLGSAYAEGAGVPKDEALAVQWCATRPDRDSRRRRTVLDSRTSTAPV